MSDRDRDHVLRARDGDPDAFGELVLAYHGLAFGVALNITGDYESSEDVVQEAFASAWRKLGTLADPGRFASWLYSIARRAAIDWGRERARRPESRAGGVRDVESLASDAETPEEAYARRELGDLLWAEVAALPPKTREAMLLRYMEGFSIRRAARFLGISESAMTTRLQYGRERLRGELREKLGAELGERQPSGRAACAAIVAALPAQKGGGAGAIAAAAARSAFWMSLRQGGVIVAFIGFGALAGVLISQSSRPPAAEADRDGGAAPAADAANAANAATPAPKPTIGAPSLEYIMGMLVYVVLGIFTATLGRGLLAGFAAARDPSHRVTPESPWFFFRRALRARLKRWPWFWLSFLALYAVYGASKSLAEAEPGMHPLVIASRAAMMPLMTLSFYVLFTALELSWAPFCEKLWTLLLLAWLSMIPVVLASTVPYDWINASHWNFSIPSTDGRQVSYGLDRIGPFFTTCYTLLLAAVLGFIRFRGERWFRFDREERKSA